jgi:hypothetical protein
VHERGLFARFRYSDLKEAVGGCGGRGHMGIEWNGMEWNGGVVSRCAGVVRRSTKDNAKCRWVNPSVARTANKWRILADSREELKLHDDEAIGVNIVKRALEEPTRQIALTLVTKAR